MSWAGRLLGPRVTRALRGAAVGAKTATDAPQAFTPGHFYSPVPDVALLRRPDEHRRVWPADASMTGVDLDLTGQLDRLARLGAVHDTIPGDGAGYDPANDQFPPHDAAVLAAMVATLAPRRMVEIGCGWSTQVTAATIRDHALDTELTCVEPYPRDFVRTIPEITRLVEARVETVDPALFDTLAAGDVLFIDSSHVAKTGSDVVHLLLDVVPRLADGVVVHVHDIFLPDDYPIGWVEAGFGWNEQYVLHGLLSGHDRLRVLIANHHLATVAGDAVRSAFGIDRADGSSWWMVMGDVPAALTTAPGAPS